MRREKFSVLVAGVCLSVVTIVPTSFTADTKTGGRVQLTSPAFEQGAAIPRKHTCDADDVSPQLRWANAPSGTKAFALIADDPDAPGGTWVHWVFTIYPGRQKIWRREQQKQKHSPTALSTELTIFTESATAVRARLWERRIAIISNFTRSMLRQT